MPRMNKQRRLEWSFFLDHRNRISYNPLLVKTLETARLRAVTIRYTPFPAKEVTFHH